MFGSGTPFHYKTLLPQKNISASERAFAMFLFFWGLYRKRKGRKCVSVRGYVVVYNVLKALLALNLLNSAIKITKHVPVDASSNCMKHNIDIRFVSFSML